MKGAHHVPELPDLPAGFIGFRVRSFGSKKSDCAVSPVIGQLFPGQGVYVDVFVGVKLLYGQQFNGSNAEVPEIGNFFNNTGKGSRRGNA